MRRDAIIYNTFCVRTRLELGSKLLRATAWVRRSDIISNVHHGFVFKVWQQTFVTARGKNKLLSRRNTQGEETKQYKVIVLFIRVGNKLSSQTCVFLFGRGAEHRNPLHCDKRCCQALWEFFEGCCYGWWPQVAPAQGTTLWAETMDVGSEARTIILSCSRPQGPMQRSPLLGCLSFKNFKVPTSDQF